MRLDGGFQPGLVYDLVYVPAACPVIGSGMLAMRDLAAFLRRDPRSPVAGKIRHELPRTIPRAAGQPVYSIRSVQWATCPESSRPSEGISQCGRLMRTFLGLGLNKAEDGGPAYDGLLIHIAGARRGEFNTRYGQPSVQPTPAFGHLFPFAEP